VAKCAAIVLRYSDAPKDAESKVRVTTHASETEIVTLPADISMAEVMRI
jgi:hypothetical protein